jgi:hypothetical protein
MAGTREVILSEDQEALLKTALQLDTRRKIPQAAIDLYSEIKITLDRLGVHHVSPEMLALIPVMLNRVARPEPKTFVDECQEHGEVKYGTRIVATFRKQSRIGRFLRMEAGKVVVELDGDEAEYRKLGVAFVRLATHDDIEKLGEQVLE